MASIFTRIINQEIPCYKIYEDEFFFAFLDINPLQPGHTLVIPKQEQDYIFDLEESALSGLILAAQKIARAMKKAFDGRRIGMSVIGLEVPHAHVHLVPITSVNDLNFSNPKARLSEQEMEEIAHRIRQCMV